MNVELKNRIFSSLVIIPISFFFVIKAGIYFISFLTIIFILTSYEWFKMSKENILFKFFGIIFLIFSLYTTYYLREYVGLNFIIFVILICVFTDIGGYIFGKTLNGPKLTKISPKKTYAGVMGSFIFALIAGFTYNEYFFQNEISQLQIILIIFLISLVSQVGDLIISYFKRKAKMKDSGKMLPGHGGLLDRIDGLIFVFPILYLCNFILV